MLAERKAFFGGCLKRETWWEGGGSWKFEAFDCVGIKVLDFQYIYICSIYDLLMLIW